MEKFLNLGPRNKLDDSKNKMSLGRALCLKEKEGKNENIAEPRGTPTTKVDSEPFSSEESISRDGNPHGEKNRNENRKKERLEDEKRDENHVQQEQSLHGDVFCEYQI